jgi:ssDNA-binding Zn-finger/Zn-ribbon topoisomerase 1
MASTKVLIRTDRNGTKYWKVTDICPRCGGRGDYILGNQNYGVCFLCYGTGKREYNVKEYTAEHEAKLEARRQAKATKRLEEKAKYESEHADEVAEKNRRALERQYAEFGCGKNGIGYALLGNTYPIKDEIKNNGGKWIYGAWVCPVEINGKGITVREINLNGHIGGGSQMWLDDFNMYEAIHG